MTSMALGDLAQDFACERWGGSEKAVIPSGVEESGWERMARIGLGETRSTALRFAQGDRVGPIV